MTNWLKKLGRRKAGSYGRPGSKAMKKRASKGVRRARLRELEAEFKAQMTCS